MDYLPLALRSWWVIVRDGDLARSSAVDSTADEADRLLLALFEWSQLPRLVVRVLAWEVTTIIVEWCIVEVGSIERSWAGHLDVRAGEGDEAEGRSDAGGKTHFVIFEIRTGRSRDMSMRDL